MKTNNPYNNLSIIVRSIFDYFNKAPLMGLVEQSVALIRGLLWGGSIYTTQKLFDSLLNYEAQSYRIIMSWFIVVIMILFLQQLLGGLSSYLLSHVSYTNMGKYMVEFQQKIGQIPPEKFEDSVFLDQLNKAKECIEYESLGHFSSICLQVITYYSVFLVAVGIYLFSLSPVLLIVILLGFVPAIWGKFSQRDAFEQLEEKNVRTRRQYDYYKKTLVGTAAYQETRLLGAANYFRKRFVQTLTVMTQNKWHTERNIAVKQMGLDIVSFLGLGLSLYILVIFTLDGQMTVGAFASVFIALTHIFSIIDEMLSVYLKNGNKLMVEVANFYRFMDINEPQKETRVPNLEEGIQLKAVSFSYPHTKRYAVENLSLTVNPGETIAIVGENGSGKSTLVKLMTGLYLPTSGSVEVGGCDTRLVEPTMLFSQISAIFQNYGRYKLTLEENVRISDLNDELNTDQVQEVLQEVDFPQHIRHEQMLSPEFGGIDLSGGLWQRLSIARGLYRHHNLIVLDEPTAAIDPIEEAKLYRMFDKVSQGKTAILVTHRLGSVKLADRIIVMHHGRIDDIGTHSELIAKQGKYTHMWDAQANWYEHGNTIT